MPGGGGEPSRYLAGAHAKHRLQYHLVWIPKYRRRVLTGPAAVALRANLYQTAQGRGWRIHELNIQPDHVHLLIQLGPDASVSDAAQALKGASSRYLRRAFPSLRAALRQDALWAVGYFAESVGAVQEETIRRYIRDQAEPDQSLPGVSK